LPQPPKERPAVPLRLVKRSPLHTERLATVRIAANSAVQTTWPNAFGTPVTCLSKFGLFPRKPELKSKPTARTTACNSCSEQVTGGVDRQRWRRNTAVGATFQRAEAVQDMGSVPSLGVNSKITAAGGASLGRSSKQIAGSIKLQSRLRISAVGAARFTAELVQHLKAVAGTIRRRLEQRTFVMIA
jgi:hypothetical protein